MRYRFTVTKCQSLRADRERTPEEIVLVETRDSFGAAMLWAQGWFKTTGANRHDRKDRHYGRTYRPTAYAIAEGGHGLNLYVQEDFNQFTEAGFIEGYLNGLKYDEHMRSLGIHIEREQYGTHIVEVHQNAGHRGTIIVLTLYCCIIDAQGNPATTVEAALSAISTDSRKSKLMTMDVFRQYMEQSDVNFISPEWMNESE